MVENFDLIASLPKECKIFCGHDYTIENYEWLVKIEKDNEKTK